MRFGISYGNHGSGVHIEDTVIYLRNALRAAGEEAYILPGLVRDGVNVLIEYFTSAQAAQIRQMKKNTRARFVVVASEFTDGKTFNSHIQSGQGHYVDTEQWRQRFDNFMEVAAEADAIWLLSEDLGVPQYQQLFDDKPVLAVPVGFDPLFPEARHPPAKSKDIDLLFSGNETPYRLGVFEALSKRHSVTTIPVSTLNIARIDMIMRSKAGLHVNIAENQRYTSVMRHHFLLMNASPVLSERTLVRGNLDDFITIFDSANFVAGVGDYLDSGQWRLGGIEGYKRYREGRPLVPPMRTLLAESFRR